MKDKSLILDYLFSIFELCIHLNIFVRTPPPRMQNLFFTNLNQRKGERNHKW